MTKKRGPRDRFANMTADEIFAAWEDAARSGLKPGQRFATEIFAPGSRIVARYKRSITRRMGDTQHPFNAADFRKTTRVAKDLGRICSIMAAAETRPVVRLDVFQNAQALARLHGSCPTGTIGTGRWCE
jgi:hypothetical protein